MDERTALTACVWGQRTFLVFLNLTFEILFENNILDFGSGSYGKMNITTHFTKVNEELLHKV